jgi:hypothetical protein
MRGVRVAEAQSYASIEKIAAKTRETLVPDLDVDVPIPGMRLFESLGKFRINAHKRERKIMYAVEGELGFGVEALTRYEAANDTFFVVLGNDTYDALETNRGGRPDFTLHHEIGHLVLHPEELIKHAAMPHHRAMLRAADYPKYHDSEWQADAFAGAFAMPADGLARLERRGKLTTGAVRATFKVSGSAAETRIRIYEQYNLGRRSA